MRTSISHLKTHLYCPAFAHYEHVMLRGGEPGKALVLGSAVHEYLAARMRGVEKEPDVPLRWAVEWEEMRESVAAWEMPGEWEVSEVEKEMELPLGRHTVVGTLDAVVRWNETWWHVQHKTLDKRVPLEVYGEQQRTDWHEMVYQKMAERAGYVPFAGTILNVYRKGLGAWVVQYLERAERVVEEGLRDVERLMDRVEDQYRWQAGTRKAAERLRLTDVAAWGENERILKNRQNCAGIYRNSVCRYKPVCDGVTTLEDERYEDLKARYL